MSNHVTAAQTTTEYRGRDSRIVNTQSSSESQSIGASLFDLLLQLPAFKESLPAPSESEPPASDSPTSDSEEISSSSSESAESAESSDESSDPFEDATIDNRASANELPPTSDATELNPLVDQPAVVDAVVDEGPLGAQPSDLERVDAAPQAKSAEFTQPELGDDTGASQSREPINKISGSKSEATETDPTNGDVESPVESAVNSRGDSSTKQKAEREVTPVEKSLPAAEPTDVSRKDPDDAIGKSGVESVAATRDDKADANTDRTDQKPTDNRRAERLAENRRSPEAGQGAQADQSAEKNSRPAGERASPRASAASLDTNQSPTETDRTRIAEATSSSVADSPTPTIAATAAAASPAISSAVTRQSSAAANLNNNRGQSIDSLSSNPSPSHVANDAGSTNRTARSEPPAKPDQLSRTQHVRLVQRVLRGFESLANGDGQVKLRLHPPQLGSMQISMKIEDAKLTAELSVQNIAASEALSANLSQLKSSLAEQGIEIERFEIRVADPENTTDPNARQNQDTQDRTSQQRDTRPTSEALSWRRRPAESSSENSQPIRQEARGLDIHG